MHNIYRILRQLILLPRFIILRYVFGFRLHKTAIVSMRAILDRSNPGGVYIGRYSIVTANCVVLSHDFVRAQRKNTIIGDNCFIGVSSVIMPGVIIGNGCVIGAGSIVTKDIPPCSLALGNPARVVRHIRVDKYGKFINSI